MKKNNFALMCVTFFSTNPLYAGNEYISISLNNIDKNQPRNYAEPSIFEHLKPEEAPPLILALNNITQNETSLVKASEPKKVVAPIH